MKCPPAQIALHVLVLLSLSPLASAESALPRLRLESESLSTLQSHSGQRVILIGYFKRDFEVSDLFPAKDQSREPGKSYFDKTVWVNFAANEEGKLLGLPFSGDIEIEGVLKAEPGGQYGHLGAFDVELTDSRIRGMLPRQFVMFGTVFTAAAAFMIWMVRKTKETKSRV